MQKPSTYLLLPLLIGLAVHAHGDQLAERHLDPRSAGGPPGGFTERGFSVAEYDDSLYERDADLEERADPNCESRAQPVVVYVTVTIDEQGEPTTQTVTQTSVVSTGPVTVAGGSAGGGAPLGGGSAVDPDTITSTVLATRTNHPTVTETEGGAGTPVPTETPADNWNDWDEDDGEGSASASASASSTASTCANCAGEDSGNSAAHIKIKTFTAALSIAISIGSSVIAGIFAAQ